MCECGQQRAGLFCLLWTLTEMLQTDKAVDVYHTTKYLQEVIPEFNITIVSIYILVYSKVLVTKFH